MENSSPSSSSSSSPSSSIFSRLSLLSVGEIHRELQRLPKQHWPRAIASLPVDKKKALRQRLLCASSSSSPSSSLSSCGRSNSSASLSLSPSPSSSSLPISDHATRLSSSSLQNREVREKNVNSVPHSGEEGASVQVSENLTPSPRESIKGTTASERAALEEEKERKNDTHVKEEDERHTPQEGKESRTSVETHLTQERSLNSSSSSSPSSSSSFSVSLVDDLHRTECLPGSPEADGNTKDKVTPHGNRSLHPPEGEEEEEKQSSSICEGHSHRYSSIISPSSLSSFSSHESSRPGDSRSTEREEGFSCSRSLTRLPQNGRVKREERDAALRERKRKTEIGHSDKDLYRDRSSRLTTRGVHIDCSSPPSSSSIGKGGVCRHPYGLHATSTQEFLDLLSPPSWHLCSTVATSSSSSSPSLLPSPTPTGSPNNVSLPSSSSFPSSSEPLRVFGSPSTSALGVKSERQHLSLSFSEETQKETNDLDGVESSYRDPATVRKLSACMARKGDGDGNVVSSGVQIAEKKKEEEVAIHREGSSQDSCVKESSSSSPFLSSSSSTSLFQSLLHLPSPLLLLLEPLDELLFVLGCCSSEKSSGAYLEDDERTKKFSCLSKRKRSRLLLSSADKRASSHVSSCTPTSKVLALYVHCWLTALLRAYHEDTVLAYCTCCPRDDRKGGGEEKKKKKDLSRLLHSSQSDRSLHRQIHSLSTSTHEVAHVSRHKGDLGNSCLRNLPHTSGVDQGGAYVLSCTCAAVKKRLLSTPNWRRFFTRYFPLEVQRFESVASAHNCMRSSLNSSPWSSSSSSSPNFSNVSLSRSSPSSSSNPVKSSNTSSRVSLLLPLPLREFYTDYFLSPLQKSEQRKISETDKEEEKEEGHLHSQSFPRNVSSLDTLQQSSSSLLNSLQPSSSSYLSVDNKNGLHFSISSVAINEMSRHERGRPVDPSEREKKAGQLHASKATSVQSLRKGSALTPPSSSSCLSRRELFDTAVHGIEVLLRPSSRFDDRLAYLHGRSRALPGKLYERFVSIRTKQALKQTLQSGLFRQALAKLAYHIWRYDRESSKEEEEDEGRWRGEERKEGENEKKEGRDEEEEEDRKDDEDESEGTGRREKDGDDHEGESTTLRSSPTVSGIIPSGMVTQMFLFLVNDRVQTCAELAVRWIYTRRKKGEEEEWRGRQMEEVEEKCKGLKKEEEEENAGYEQEEKGKDGERKLRKDSRGFESFSFPSPDDFRQNRDLQASLLSLQDVDSLLLSLTAVSGEKGVNEGEEPCERRRRRQIEGRRRSPDTDDESSSDFSAVFKYKQKRQLRDFFDMKIKKKRFKDDEANRRKKSRHTRDDGSEGSDEEEEEEEENANRDVRSSSISEEEATSALVCAANLLFHCVDQPLFNIHARDFKICSPPPLPLSGRKRRRGPTAGTVSSTASLNDTALDEREGLLQPTKSVGDLSSSSSSDSLLNAVDNEGSKITQEMIRHCKRSVRCIPVETSSLVASSCKETDPLWSSLMEAAVQFCTQQEEEEEEEEEEQEEEEEEEETSRSRNSNKKRRMDGKGKRRLRERKGRGKEDEDERDRKSCKENEELKKKKKKEKWRVPGLDLFGAFVVVRIQQLFTSTRGKADCHQMLTQVVQEWREAAAALGKRKDEDEEEEEKKTDNDEDRREKKGDKEKTQQDSKKTQLLLSLHGQLQQMYAHMAAAAKMTALLSLLQSNCPSLIPRPPQHLSLQQLLDFQQILQKQGEALRMKLEKEHFTEIKSLVKEEKEE